VHCHASTCVSMSLADTPVSCVHVQSGRFGRGVPIYPRPIYILDRDEGADLARTLGDAKGMMIKGHGIVAVGQSIDEACMNAVYMERTAKIMTTAKLFGFTGVPDDFIETLAVSKEKLLTRGKRMAHSAEWNYYAEKLQRGETWTRGGGA
jgi:ribulose-5-phosphate 4-epimerase/fuculose-1-phosphate aldolase